MKWEKTYLLLGHNPIKEPAGKGVFMGIMERFKIPRAHVVIPKPGSLTAVTKYSKLLLLGHGNEAAFAIGDKHYRPADLAQFLAYLGLKEVGLISFRACLIGSGNYLDLFRDELNKKNIKVGWLKGYTHLMGALNYGHYAHLDDALEWWKIFGTETDNGIEVMDYHRSFPTKRENRVKIVQGNIGVTPLPLDERYGVDPFDWSFFKNY